MTIARVYTVPFDNISFGGTADRNFWEILAPSDKKLIIHGFGVTSAQGVTAAELCRLTLKRYSTGGTGTAATEVKNDTDNGATIGAAVIHTVSPGTPGDVIMGWQWSQQGELLHLPTPEMRIIVPASGRLGLYLPTALAAARNWSGWLCWEEL